MFVRHYALVMSRLQKSLRLFSAKESFENGALFPRRSGNSGIWVIVVRSVSSGSRIIVCRVGVRGEWEGGGVKRESVCERG